MGNSFDEVAKRRRIIFPRVYRKYERKGFNTPSGKIELYSKRLKDLGEDPLCVKVCPVEGAIAKNEDGIVVLSHNRCILCQPCVSVCPYGALELNPDREIIGKCNFV